MNADAEKEIKSLKQSLTRLQQDLVGLRKRFEEEFPTLEDILRRRGIKIYHANPLDDFLLSP